jgi:hypothetical protein
MDANLRNDATQRSCRREEAEQPVIESRLPRYLGSYDVSSISSTAVDRRDEFIRVHSREFAGAELLAAIPVAAR